MSDLQERLAALPGFASTMRRRVGFMIILAMLLMATVFFYSPAPDGSVLRGQRQAAVTLRKHWGGWHSVNHLIVFGDSYSSTGFNSKGEQPSAANPMGNPGYPGSRTSNGPNWVDFLTTTHNASCIKTLDFAFGGATVNQDILRQVFPGVKSFRDQVEKIYLADYSPPPSTFAWKTTDTLFAIFFGINDVKNALDGSTPEVLDKDVAEYARLVDVLYQSGGRNFLFMHVPPFEKSPTMLRLGPGVCHEYGKAVAAYNADINRIARNLTRTYIDATAIVFDTHGLYGQVLREPCSHPETCELEDTTTTCGKYDKGTDDWYTSDPDCPHAVDRYFWLNPLHPGFRMHNVTAKAVAQRLS